MKNLLSKLFLGAALWASFVVANAADTWSQTTPVPFDFKVEKVSLPAGQYRVEQEFGKFVVYLVNVNTGQRVQLLREGAPGLAANARLTFELTSEGYVLRRIS